jgi:hypothetical protein
VSRKTNAITGLERRQIEKLIRFKNLPYNPFRHSLYTVKELMRGYNPEVPGKSLDEVIAQHYNRGKKMPNIHEALAQRIHDHAIDTALYRFAKSGSIERRRIVGVMEVTAKRELTRAINWLLS